MRFGHFSAGKILKRNPIAKNMNKIKPAKKQLKPAQPKLPANAFVGQSKPPTNAGLAAALGPTKTIWDQLLTDLAQECEANVQEWNSYSPKAGWSLRVKCKKRTILWLAPCAGCFSVAFIFGDKAMQMVRQSKWPKRLIKVMDEAPKYPEGTGIRLQVKSSRDIGILKKLAAIKLAN